MQYYPAITILRIVGSLLVVLYHVLNESKFIGLIPAGYNQSFWQCGVDLFFISSGFVIWDCLHRCANVKTFLAYRALRIMPLYWAFTILLMVLFFVVPQFFSTAKDGMHGIESLFFLSQLLNNGKYPVLQVGWTLEFEFLLYGVCGALFYTAKKIESHSKEIFLVGFTFLVTVSLVLGFKAVVWEFLLGIWLSAFKHIFIRNFFSSLFIAAAGLVLLVYSLFFDINVGGEIERFVHFGIPWFLIICGTHFWRVSDNRGLLASIDPTYSIYLTHPFIIQPFFLLVEAFEISNLGLIVSSCLSLCIAVGLATHIFLDQPLRILITKKFGNASRRL